MPTTTGTAPEQKDHRHQSRPEDRINLASCYGKIGISAVAAALRYAGTTKNPAYAPVVHRIDLRFAERAA